MGRISVPPEAEYAYFDLSLLIGHNAQADICGIEHRRDTCHCVVEASRAAAISDVRYGRLP
jgi:hypothetical protein